MSMFTNSGRERVHREWERHGSDGVRERARARAGEREREREREAARGAEGAG